MGSQREGTTVQTASFGGDVKEWPVSSQVKLKRKSPNPESVTTTDTIVYGIYVGGFALILGMLASYWFSGGTAVAVWIVTTGVLSVGGGVLGLRVIDFLGLFRRR